jgi:hypothetical protein
MTARREPHSKERTNEAIAKPFVDWFVAATVFAANDGGGGAETPEPCPQLEQKAAAPLSAPQFEQNAIFFPLYPCNFGNQGSTSVQTKDLFPSFKMTPFEKTIFSRLDIIL